MDVKVIDVDGQPMIEVAKDGVTIRLTAQEVAALLGTGYSLLDRLGWQSMPAIQEPFDTSAVPRAEMRLLRLPDNAKHLDPSRDGAGLFLGSRSFGWVLFEMTPDQCKQTGRWLLGQHGTLDTAAPTVD